MTRAKIKCVARWPGGRQLLKETISYIIAIRETSIRCTITPRIPTTNTTLANFCRVHIVYIQRIKLGVTIARKVLPPPPPSPKGSKAACRIC